MPTSPRLDRRSLIELHHQKMVGKEMLKRAVMMALLLSFSLPVMSQDKAGVSTNGVIVEQARYEFPVYDRLPEWLKRIFSPRSYGSLSRSTEFELLKIKYLSNGDKVVGFVLKPRLTKGKKFPALIFNRGGIGEAAKIGNQNFDSIYEMYRYASAGFVVLASQYRGVDGGEGTDEVGGADLADVMNLRPLAESLAYVDTKRLFICGSSRGAQMALQAIRDGLPVRAAVIIGTPTDWGEMLKRNPQFEQTFKTIWPDFELRREEHIRNRSALSWAEQINVPLLIFHGGADEAVPSSHSITFAGRLTELGKVYELIIYANDDHPVNFNREDRLRRTIEWFKNPPRIPVGSVVSRAIKEQGLDVGVKLYRDLKRTQPELYDFGEGSLNRLGYVLLGERKVKEAIQIFKLNAESHPESSNAYDSLGEAYAIGGERELAIRSYKLSLALNPRNRGAAEALKLLENK